jgi:hypothetical protein
LNVQEANVNPNSRPSPPDVAMAVGPNHVMQIVHHGVQIWDKTGNILGFSYLEDFFNTENGHFIGDQDILYDNASGHWFATIFDLGLVEPHPENGEMIPTCKPNGCSILVAVSSSDDPTNSWSLYPFNFGYVIPDYPHIAVNDDKLLFTVNDFPIYDEGYNGVQILVADKNALIRGDTQDIPYMVTPPTQRYFTLLPVRAIDSTECIYMLSTDSAVVTNPNNPVFTQLNLFNACGNPSNNDVQINHLKDIPMAGAPLPVSAFQPDIPKKIDTGDERMLTAVYGDGMIVNGFNTSCLPGGTSAQTCIRLQIINVTDFSLIDDTNIGIRGLDVYHPAIAVDGEGKFAFMTAVSGSDAYLSLLAGDENYNLKLLAAGGSAINDHPADPKNNRYGDYLASATDPVDGSIWVSGEYVDPNLPGTWSTAIGHIPK